MIFRNSYVTVLLRVFLVILPHYTFPQNCWNIERVGSLYSIWEWPYDIELSGGYGYVASGYSGFRVVDISDPLNPYEVADIDTFEWIWNLTVEGNYAYVGGNYGDGCRVIDISDPQNPTQVAQFGSFKVSETAILDNIAYIAAAYGGLFVVDISDPIDPMQIGWCSVSPYAAGIAVQGDHAYLTTWESGGLSIINISDPCNPYQVGTFSGPYLAWRVDVCGDYAYIADGWGHNLWIVDVSDPTDPTEAGICYAPGVIESISVEDCYAYCANAADGYGGMNIFDISSPTNPCQLGSSSSESAYDVEVEGNYAFTVDHFEGLRVQDVSDVNNPFEVASYNNEGRLLYVVLEGGFAYIADQYQGLRIVNISNPEEPFETGLCSFQEDIASIAASESYAYIGAGAGGVHITDVSDPNAPLHISTCNLTGYVNYIAHQGNYVYATSGPNHGLRIIDVSNPYNPFETGYLEYIEAVWIDVVGDYAYVTGNYNGLYIIDVSNPNQPLETAHLTLEDVRFQSISVYENRAYINTWGLSTGKFMRVIDVTDPFNPAIIGMRDLPSCGQAIKLVGEHAFITFHLKGLWIYNISNPENIVLTGYHDTPGRAEGVDVSGSYAYVANWYTFEILDCSDAVPVEFEDHNDLPTDFAVISAFPNPFNSSTIISFVLPVASEVKFELVDLTGRQIRTCRNSPPRTSWYVAGRHEVTFDAEDLPSGVYLVNMVAGDYQAAKKLVLMK